MWLSRDWREFIAQQHGYAIDDPVHTQTPKHDVDTASVAGDDQGETQHEHFLQPMKYRAEIHFAIHSGYFTSPEEVHRTVDEFFCTTKYPERWSVEHIEDYWVCCTFRTPRLDRIKKVHERLQELEEDARFEHWSICREHRDGSLEAADLGTV